MVTLEELKAHLRIETDDEDDCLSNLIKMAETTVEDFCGQSFSEAPEPVRLAVLLFAGHHYAQRENGDPSSYNAMMTAFHALLWPYRNPDALF